MRRHATLALCAVLPTLLAASTAASADVFGPISLASESAVPGSVHNQQADYANDAVISGDGRYIAFDGSFGGRTGVFRRDLLTGEVTTVAEGDVALPSISEDGRYVSFTTTARLDEENDTNSAPDVYVRDMENPDFKPCGPKWEELHEPCAFTLASAVNGSPQGLSYKYGSNQAFEETHLGSVASGRSALSADGRYVAFVTTAESNLANPNRPASPRAPETPETPALQVAVRDLDTKETKLVSIRYDPASGGPEVNEATGQDQPVPTSTEGSNTRGAVYPGPLAFPNPWEGASISADGSTVAWMGQEIAQQAPVLSSDLAAQANYSEPLWRRIDEGPRVPTRRVTGGSDPANPLCAASGETQLTQPPTLSDPCQGPFDSAGAGASPPGIWTNGTTEDYLPRLSADGMKVAFLSNAREIAGGEEFNSAESSDDLYVINMADGLTRVQALRRLTELAGGNFSDPARVAPIVDLGVSPDGAQIAFSTERTVFPLGAPAFVSAPAAAVGMVELFDVDLADETLTRVTQGYEGQPSEAPSGTPGLTDSPSFSTDGDLLAFSSNAENLVYGEGNQAGNAFVVPRLQFASTPTPEYLSSVANPSFTPVWELGVTALSGSSGSVLLYVQAPGSGTLRAGAQSAVVTRSALIARTGHRARHSALRERLGGTVATRTVATRETDAQGAGLQMLTLTLAARYRSLALEPGGLSATVTVIFTSPGRPALRESIPVTFLRKTKRSKARSHKTSSRSSKAGRRR